MIWLGSDNPLRVFAALVVATVVGVSAQDACILGCLQQSESPSTCTSYTNLTCVCSNKAFQSASAACLNANCTTADQQTALELELGRPLALAASSTSPPASSSSSSTASTPTTSSNGAVYDQVPFLNWCHRPRGRCSWRCLRLVTDPAHAYLSLIYAILFSFFFFFLHTQPILIRGGWMINDNLCAVICQ
ncbi:hypothetical protein EDB86DRAFT_2407710 [Lactarius hatsudake]|nr:hypothetical protein EDB86DRAFT_2407710 [Lactarius hatsudake]